MAASGKTHRDQLLWAMHLEVFVPKPGKRFQEEDLLRCLDSLLEAQTVPILKRPNRELAALDERHRKLFESRDHWENIIFGYSAYSTDGYFMPLKDRVRRKDYCYREVTLVFKFILTNYHSSVLGFEAAKMLPGIVTPSDFADREKRNELRCMEFHYQDTAAYIVDRTCGVLEHEAEIWSQAWYSLLNRKTRPGVGMPIATVGERSRRPKSFERVICVHDYAAEEVASRRR
jgi:hypothetical protein